jgi:ADP-ribose pyrophosphatase
MPASDSADARLAETVLSSRMAFEGRLVDLRVDEVRLASGRTSTREVVVHRGAVAVIPMLADGRVVLIRQFRQAAGQVLLEIPAGTLEPGEDPDACALRELAEETGYTAARVERLFASYLAPGYSTELLHVYLARDVRPVGSGEAAPEDDEAIEVVRVPLAEAASWVLTGGIRDAKTICGLLLAERLLAEGV